MRPPFAVEAFSDLDADVPSSSCRIHASPFIPHKDVRSFVHHAWTDRLGEVS